MPWVIVDGQSRRFMNEYPPAPQDTPIRELIYYNADTQTYPRIPSYLVFDENGRSMGPIGRPVMNDPSLAYDWSDDNLREVDAGVITKGASITELAMAVGIEANALADTIARWNEASLAGRDDDHQRPGWSMVPIEAPPFYIVPVYPLITNTQGGLVHDSEQRVLDPFGEPVPRLFKAGENGSIYGHLYLLGGNNTECLVGGWIAGANAAREASADRVASEPRRLRR